MLSSVLYLLFSSTSVEAHSWIQCTDYRGDTNYYDGSKCFGHVRPWQRGPNDIVSPNQDGFGVDQGFNKMLHEGPDGQCNTLIDNQFAAGNFPMATYQRGATITLAWPAKNHVPETCDNNPGGAGLPDAFNGLYMERSVPGLRINYNREVVFEPMTAGNRHVRGQIDYKGFGKCPKFCENRDKALCTGTFVVPDVPDGKYSFSWRWEFNGGRNPPETYVTCFEAMVQGDNVQPETGDKWDEGGIGMFIERGQGCNDHTNEDRCLSYADGRDERAGQRCAWCCGENCRDQGAEGYKGGDNFCEPVSWLNENGIKRYRTAGQDLCNPPTIAPSPEPTESPSESPTEAPTEAPSEKPTEAPTEQPTENPTDSMMAPDPRGAAGSTGAFTGECTGSVNLGEQCGGLNPSGVMMEPACCSGGNLCMPVTELYWRCEKAVGQGTSEGGMPMQTVLIIVFAVFVVAVCCGTLLVYKLCIAKDSDDDYHKQDSLSDRDTRGRYSDRNERRRKDRKRSRRSRDDSRSRSPRRGEKTRRHSRSPKRSDTQSSKSWVDEN